MGFSVRKEVPILKNPIDKEKVEESLKKIGKHTDQLDHDGRLEVRE